MAKKIMVCDDDPGILELMEMVIEEYGFQVFTEAKSTNILNRLEQEKPDLLLLDIWMPILSGDQVLKIIKAESKHAHLPVIMYSASTEGLAISQMAGANDYIAKPFDYDELNVKIKTLLTAE